VPLGAAAGYFRGWVDGLIMRVTDLFLAFPPLLLAMAIVAALGPGLQNATLALVISWWPWYARIARGLAVSLREWPFVDASRAMGIRDSVIIFRHIVPNSIGPIVVQATIDIGTVILAAGGLAFIGLGARPPAPDWGLMVAEGRQYILEQWWLSTFPGLAIFFTVLAFNLVGDLLLRLLDPRQED
jgi:peptide/nickel transport system permease protein